ncbi:triacylglycerol lipase OBL1-like isoform X1 [Macadamia integrifolia]|uniref:triacylglycerol lipase OBL1-like isoform X1 n=1 Tax=Macadamia integrifolia TaxID=60698 RepID=UPI001C4FA908|nr:triacylglycerol lipase OBL1-like isoform X1 [Macadamia integrifolia]
MASSGSSSYMIYHPENLNIFNMFSSTFALGGSLEGSGIVESSPQETISLRRASLHGLITSFTLEGLITSFTEGLITRFTLILQRIMIWLSGPAALFGLIIEFTLNLFVLNGGIFGFPWSIITESLKIPKPYSAGYLSMVALMDERRSLANSSYLSSPLLFKLPVHDRKFIYPLDLCVMASKVAYENKKYIKHTVTTEWKMHFVKFYNCWNECLKSKETQAFIFCDKREDAEVIVVAFRGTELFNLRDWLTDIDLSWLKLGEMGKVHVGFMKALGIQDEKCADKGWPKEYTGKKKLAYYTIRKKLRKLVKENPNAKILVTGHSLGGALAVLFPAILVFHQDKSILDKLDGIFTFGQPRVGDTKFRDSMEKQLNGNRKKYYRVVHRYDIVPRVPLHGYFIPFAHFGGCIYYKSWYKAQILPEEPNKNYFNPLHFPSKYINAWLDLFRGLIAGIRHGKDFKENRISIGVRLFGLLIPGFASHSPRDYVNDARLGNLELMEDNI